MRKVCIVTGTRAEYGLLHRLMKAVAADPRLALQVVATGMHLSPEFGMTVSEVERDGFTVDARVDMLLSGDSPVAVTKSLGLGVIGFADAFHQLEPDIVVLLGDRFEILAAAQAAMIARIPIAHIHGGEATEGLIDEAIRHAVTKMAHLHFATAEPYRHRIIQLGEQPGRVFNVGAPGVDNILHASLPAAADVLAELSLDGSAPLFLVTYHPVTLDGRSPGVAVAELTAALDRFPNANIVLTKANADTDGRIINRMLEEYAQARPERVRAVTSLGYARYLGLMHQAAAVIGNSSSGLLEAPSLGVPTVNIGDRQRGRLRAPSVIDCAENATAIVAAIERANSAEWKAIAARRETPFGRGGTAAAIAEVLATCSLDGILFKRFHDL